MPLHVPPLAVVFHCTYIALPRSAEILLHPEDSVQVEAGMGVTLTCVVYGSPLPEVTWTREGERIENSSDAAMYQTYLEHLNNTLVQSLLELCPALAGNYGCSATNTHGDDTVSFQVAVQRGKIVRVVDCINGKHTLQSGCMV